MDPLIHLRIHDQEHHSFDRAVRRGRVAGQASPGGRLQAEAVPADEPARATVQHGVIGGLARLFHVRHA